MNIYAYILNNIVQTLALVDSLELADTLATDQGMDRVEDVTELDPRPQPGWIWIAGEAPVPGSPPPNPAARGISNLQLVQRFTEIEWENIATHTAAAARAFVARLQVCGNIWLDDPRLINALDRMVTAGILTADRPAQIRV